MLTEMSLYDCPDEPNRLYGHNPFIQKCIDITDYEGPTRPPKPKKIKKDVVDDDRPTKKDVVDKPVEWDKLPVVIPEILLNPDEWARCAMEHPIASIGGLLIGGYGAHRIASSGLLKASWGAAKGLAKVGKFGAKAAWKIVPKSVSGALVAAAIGGSMWYYWDSENRTTMQNVGRAISGPLGTLGLDEWAKAVDVKVTEFENFIDVNTDNVACGIAALIGGAVLYTTLRVGVIYGPKALKRGGALLKDLTQRLSKSLTKIISKSEPSQAGLFMLLRNELADGVKLKNTIEMSKDAAGKLVFSVDDFGETRFLVKDLTGPMFKMSDDQADVIAKRFKDFIKPNAAGEPEFIIRSADINADLAKLSDDAVADVTNTYTKEAGELSKTGESGRNLKRTMKMLAKGMVSRADVRTEYFKTTSDLFDALTDSATPIMRELNESSITIAKLERSMGLNPRQITKLRQDIILDGLEATEVVNKMLDDKIIKTSSRGDALKYVKEIMEFNPKAQALEEQFTAVSKILDEEAKFAKLMGSADEGTPLLKDWLKTPGSNKFQKFQKELSLWMPNIKDAARSGALVSALKKMFFISVFATATYKTIGFVSKKEQEAFGPEVTKLAEDFCSKYVDDEYAKDITNRDETIDVNKLFEDFLRHAKATTPKSASGNSLINLISEFVQKAKTSSEVREYFNEKGQEIREGGKNLEADFLQLIQAEFGGTLEQPTELPISISGKPTKIKFENRGNEGVLSVGNREFQFVSDLGTARIVSAKRVGSRFHMALKVSFINRTYKLNEQQLVKLFLEANKDSFQTGMTKNFKKIDDKHPGDIKRIAEINKNLKEVKIMSRDDLGELIKKVLTENSGQGYSKYPYGSSVKEDEEPEQDYIEEWKALSTDLIRDESRNTAIEIAKLLVKDLELFEDVLDLAGQNQSVGTEILSKLKEARENS